MRIIKVGNTFRTYDDSLETSGSELCREVSKEFWFLFRKICRHRNQRKNLRSTYE